MMLNIGLASKVTHHLIEYRGDSVCPKVALLSIIAMGRGDNTFKHLDILEMMCYYGRRIRNDSFF
jgi:hypothetical protein